MSEATRTPKRNKLALLLLLAFSPVFAHAARQTTTDQLREILISSQAAHRDDKAVQAQLANVKLSNRLSRFALQQLILLSPGPKTTQALRTLADSSAFLDPPASEIPPTATPTVAEQKAIVTQVIHYVAKTIPKLPDFSATRITDQYADSRPNSSYDSPALPDGLFQIANLKTPIAYHDGRETDDPTWANPPADPAKSKSKARQPSAASAKGLSSWGEFGPILGIVLVDVAKGKITWAHWEQQGDKRIAVFKFSVDRSVSHYNVEYCCEMPHETNENAALATPGQAVVWKQISGYHGHLDVDPADGIILGITIEADLRPEDHVQRAATTVEYGPVQIGDKTFFCPVHSVSISVSREETKASPISPIVTVNRTLLNDVEFTGYHRFGSEVVMNTEPEKPPAPNQDSASQSAQASTPTPSNPTAESDREVSSSDASKANANPTEASPSTPRSVTQAAEDEEFLVQEVDALPGAMPQPDPSNPSRASSPSGNSNENGTFTLKTTTRLVDISLIATDKHDTPVTNLKPEEIEIYDNGRKQQIRAFHHPSATSNPSPASAAPAADTGTYTNTAPQAASVADAPDLLILLLDEAHLPFNDLNRARGEVLRYLKAARPDARVALYSISEHGFSVIQGITTDHTLLQSRLAAWMPSASAVSQAQALDRRDRQQFDTVHSVQDLNSVNGNNQDSPEAITSIDPELRQMGDNPLRSALIAMVGLAHHFASVPGHKSLAWISGDSVLADWEDKQVRTEKGNKANEAALIHTMEALNEAHISLYAVDASPSTPGGGAAVSAELANASVQLNPTATANSRPGGAGGPSGAAIGAARATEDMQQNSRAIQGPVRQLAETTGGLAINKGSDLKGTLDGIDRHASAIYELGFDPDTPADNKFHTLQLKITHRKDIKLRYRTGYLYNEEAATTQSRFQQAIWSPQDATGIHLTAEPVSPENTPSGKSAIRLRVALAGLDLNKTPDPQNRPDSSGRYTDRLYIYLAERDDATQKAKISGETLRLSLKPATYDSGLPAGIPYQRTVEPGFKQGSIRVIVVDANSGNIGSVTLPASALHP